MASTPQFYDHFAQANLSIQERLGRSGAALNKDSAVFGQQTRSFLQMFNFGLDAMTARAASHLLNWDILHSNDAYLLKHTEGVLLNSIVSITPPKINASTPFRFWSERTYSRWSSLGTISLKDGTKVNLIAFKIRATGNVEGSDKGVEYEALYCAGNYVQQTIDSGFDGYTPGIFAPVMIPETYKSVWSESVEVMLTLDDGTEQYLKLAWSMPELLAMPDTSYAALIQNTPRGMTLTLGDGEIFGKGYNNKTGITSVVVTYVKCDSLAPVDHSTIKFNSDISEIFINGEGVPLLSPLNVGDTVDSLRSRAVAEFFAASKITNERDLEVDVGKIPFVKSCSARREYNWPVWDTIRRLYAGYNSRGNTRERQFYLRYIFSPDKQYGPGAVVVVRDALWMCISPNASGRPTVAHGWIKFMDLANGAAIGAMYSKYFPSANIYDNATIVLSGLVLKNRRYWNEFSVYSRGDVVYHDGTKQLWLALQDVGQSVEPGSEQDVPFYGDGGVLQRYWASREEAEILEAQSSQTSNPYNNVGYKFDDYEQITQSIFESELKGYFNIAGKLGFTSVVVEPLAQVGVSITCRYHAPYTMQQQIHQFIEDYTCYHVHKVLSADDLNSQLTEKFNLTSVGVSIRLLMDNEQESHKVELPEATYVPPSLIEINLQEVV